MLSLQSPRFTGSRHASRLRETLTRHPLLCAVLAAFAIRLALLPFAMQGLTDPTRGYEQFGWEMGWVARAMALGHGFSSPFVPFTGATALVPPLFPALLARVFGVFGVYTAASGAVILTLDSLFSALTCIPIYFAVQPSFGDRAARLAAWGWVVYPFAVYFQGMIIWDYALTALLFATSFCLLQRVRSYHGPFAWIGLGAMLGLTALSNPSILSVTPLLVALAASRFGRPAIDWLRDTMLAGLVALAVLTPWAARNYRQLHVICPVRDGFWLEFWSGNTGDTFESNPAWTHPASNPVEMRLYQSLGETAYIAQKHQLATAFVRQHPGFFVWVSLRRAFRFWTGFWSFNRRYLQKEFLDIPNLFFCSGITVLMLLGLRRAWQWNRSATLPYAVLLILFPLPYYLSHASMDYRQPIEPEILILASLGAFGLRDPDRSAEQDGVWETVPRLAEEETETAVLALEDVAGEASPS